MIIHDKTGNGDGLTEDSTAIRELSDGELDAVSGGEGDGPGCPGGEGCDETVEPTDPPDPNMPPTGGTG